MATLTASRVHQGKVRKLRIFEPTAYYSIDYIDQEVKVFPLSGRQTDIKTFKIKKEEPLKKEIENFLRCINEGKTGKVSGEEGLRALRLAHAVLREIETAKLSSRLRDRPTLTEPFGSPRTEFGSPLLFRNRGTLP